MLCVLGGTLTAIVRNKVLQESGTHVRGREIVWGNGRGW